MKTASLINRIDAQMRADQIRAKIFNQKIFDRRIFNRKRIHLEGIQSEKIGRINLFEIFTAEDFGWKTSLLIHFYAVQMNCVNVSYQKLHCNDIMTEMHNVTI